MVVMLYIVSFLNLIIEIAKTILSYLRKLIVGNALNAVSLNNEGYIIL